MTPAERLLWSRIRREQLAGLQFRRQHPLAGYFLDFYCAQQSLAIELDGDSHFDPLSDAQARDDDRSAVLEAYDVRVIRFTNTEVFDSIDEVLKKIASACGINFEAD